MIDFVTESAFEEARDAFVRTASTHDSKVYEDWLRLHRALVTVAEEFGKVTDHWEGGDFYHCGDWFTSLTDGFAIRTVSPLSKIKVDRFQRIIAEHSPYASLSISGEVDTPLDGLEFLIHSQAIIVAWQGKNREDCRHCLLEYGFGAE